MKCPHCKQRADFKAHIYLTADEIYECNACGQKSQMKRNRLLSGLLSGFGAVFIFKVYWYSMTKTDNWIYVSAILISMSALFIFLGYKSIRLQTIKTQEDVEQEVQVERKKDHDFKTNPYAIWGRILALSIALLIVGFLLEYIWGYSKLIANAIILAIVSIIFMMFYFVIGLITRLFSSGEKIEDQK